MEERIDAVMDPEFDPLAFSPSPTQNVSRNESGSISSALHYPGLQEFYPSSTSPSSKSERESESDKLLHPKKDHASKRQSTPAYELLSLNVPIQKSSKPELIDRATLQPVPPTTTKPKNPFLVDTGHSAQNSLSDHETEEKKSGSVPKSSSSDEVQSMDRLKRMEEDFGRQRKQFITQMLLMENEVERCKVLAKKKAEECSILQHDLKSKDREVEDVRAAAAISEALLKEGFQDEHKQMIDEINSLRQIVKVTKEDESYNLDSLQRERASWNSERQRLQSEIGRLQQSYMQQPPAHHLPYPPTRLPAHQVPEQGPGLGFPPTLPTSTQHMMSQPSQAPRLARAESLEKHMEKAHEESERLRTVIIPLEEEIAFLKAKLGQAENKIKSLEGSSLAVGQLIEFGSDDEHTLLLGDVDNEGGPQQSPTKEEREEVEETGEKKPAEVVVAEQSTEQQVQPVEKKAPKPEKPKKSKLQKLLDKERSLRSDVEIKLDVMTTQRNVLQDDLQKAHSEVDNLRRMLEKENQSKEELKKTWEMANFQFLELQQQYKTELDQLKQSSGSRPGSSVAEPLVNTQPQLSEDLVDSSDDVLKEPLVSLSTEQDKLDGASFSRDVDEYTAMVSSEDQKMSIGSGAVSGLDTLMSQLGTMKAQLSRKDKICQKLQSELKTLKVTLDEEVQEKEKAVAKHESDVSKYQVALAQEQTERRLLEKKLLKMKEEITTRVSTFEESVKKTKLELNKGRDDLVKLKVDTQEEVVKLSKDRQEIWDKVKSAREEYACLKQQHLMELEEQARRMTLAEVAQHEAESNVAVTVEHLSQTQSQMFQEKEKLLGEMSHLRGQLLKEQEEKREVLSKAKSDVASSTEKIEMWQKRCEKLEENFKARQDAVGVAEQFKEKMQAALQEKNKEIQQLQRHVETLQEHLRHKKMLTQ